jgi:hypothetical protein
MAYDPTYLDYPEDQHQARLLMGDPKAEAWEWINAYAKNLSRPLLTDDWGETDGGTVTPQELIETAICNAKSEDRWGGEYISKGGLLEGVSTDPTLWDKVSILIDKEIPQDKRNNFFSCSC